MNGPTRLGALLATVLVLTVGCLEGLPGAGTADEREWWIGGWFEEDATQDEVTTLGERLLAIGVTINVMESHPMQYAAFADSEAACEDAKVILAETRAVASVGVCRERQDVENPEETATDEAEPGPG